MDRRNEGSDHYKAALTKDDVVVILRLLGAGHKHKDIASLFGVTRPTVSYIGLGTTWKHVPREST